MQKIIAAGLLAAALALSGCGQLGLNGQVLAPTARPAPSALPSSSPAPTRPPDATAAPTDPAAGCPTPGEGQALYLSRDNGFCFLYPATFKALPDFIRPAQVVDLNGPSLTQRQDTAVVHVGVAANGPAGALDSHSYADKWQTFFRPDPALAGQPFTLAGQAAVLFDNLPGGMFGQRVALVVANGYKYAVTLSPLPGDVPELASAAQQSWDLVVQSLTVFTPAKPLAVAQPDAVCPQPGADTKLWVNEAQGFCLLYPADFALSPDLANQLVGGPVLLDTQEWGPVRTSLTVAGYDQPPSPAQQPDPPQANVDLSTVMTTTIGGGAAITYDTTGAPWRQRTADILIHGYRYTLIGPWDPQVLPHGLPDAQRLWDTVTQSIVFFEKWR